jgi:hypothetical protein
LTSKKQKKQDKKGKTDSVPTINQEGKKESDEIIDGSSNVLRSLTIIYGFFFVFMSAMVAGAQNLRTSLGVTSVLFFYFFIIVLALACFLIGFEIYIILIEFDISNIGEWGVVLLILLVPMIFVFVIGQAILVEVVIFGTNIAPLGIWIISWTELLITSLLLWRTRRDGK